MKEGDITHQKRKTHTPDYSDMQALPWKEERSIVTEFSELIFKADKNATLRGLIAMYKQTHKATCYTDFVSKILISEPVSQMKCQLIGIEFAIFSMPEMLRHKYFETSEKYRLQLNSMEVA